MQDVKLIWVNLSIFVLTAVAPRADPLGQWNWRGPRPVTTTLFGVAYGRGLFVGVGNPDWPSGILTSIDGKTWIPRVSPTAKTLLGVGFGGGQFVATGEMGTILTSGDGIDWTAQSSGVTNHLLGVCYGQGNYVAVGAGGTVLSSVDGQVWRQLAPGTTEQLSTVAYGNGVFLAGGLNNALLLSQDGLHWQLVGSGVPGGYDFSAITYGAGLFVALRSEGGPFFTSPDGVAWDAPPVSPAGVWHRLVYGDGKFVAVGPGSALISTDGRTWTTGGIVTTNRTLTGVTYGSGQFVATGTLGAVFTSKDGIMWENEQMGNPMSTLLDVTWASGLFVAVGGTKLVYDEQVPAGRGILTSRTGVSWEEAPPTVAPWALWNEIPVRSVGYGAGRFVGVQLQVLLGQFSSDGVHWSAIEAAATGGATPAGGDVAYGNGQFVSVGPDYTGYDDSIGQRFKSMVSVSPDGLNWRSLLPPPTTNFLWGVAFGDNGFVSVGDLGTILVSTNSVDWQSAASGTRAMLQRIEFGGGRYIATGASGTILLSTNGVSWSLQTSGVTNTLYGVSYGDGNYVVVGERGTILTSTNGIRWSLRPSGTRNDLFGVTYGNGTFVVVGARQTVLQSQMVPFPLKVSDVREQPSGLAARVLTENGRNFRIEASTNLLDWTDISVTISASEGMLLLEPGPLLSPKRFFRAVAP